METREFREHDWHGFQGAEAWHATSAEGALPLIATGTLENGKEYVVVLDRNGAALLIEDEEQTDFGGWQICLPFPTQHAARAFATGLGEPKRKSDFFQVGFEAL
jgi:hypothetical protein